MISQPTKRANAATLKTFALDRVAIPAKLEADGWASWPAEKGIVTLRNPSGHPQDFTADIAALLELPA